MVDADLPVMRATDPPEESAAIEETFPAAEAAEERRNLRSPGGSRNSGCCWAGSGSCCCGIGGQMLLQLALLFGFPCLVVIFAWDGLPQIKNFTSAPAQNALQQVLETASFSLQAVRVGGLVSGLVMFQVILLTLMGSNNAAREIAGQRAIFEKEKFAGLRPSAFLASKAVYLAVVAAAQSIWMALFVNTVCHFPGDLVWRRRRCCWR